MLLDVMEFPSLNEARDYRRQIRHGAWLFEDETTGETLAFPHENGRGDRTTAREIMQRPEVRGRFGKLYS
jgi:hypothetical protein